MSYAKKKKPQDFLSPLSSKKRREEKFAVLDIESKEDDTQRAGFTRPFLVGVLDPHEKNPDAAYVAFENLPHVADRHWQDRATSPGGCIDRMMHYLLDERFSKRSIYAHNGGRFDHLFPLRWLREHSDEYAFDVIPVQSGIQKLTVWPKNEDPDHPSGLRWNFLDSVRLVGMSLKDACKAFNVLDGDGIPIGKIEHDLNLHESHPLWRPYLKQDCYALSVVMTRLKYLVEEKLGGALGMTAPATSMKTFRMNHLGKGDVPKYIARYQHWETCEDPMGCGGCAHEWYRLGYYGGRTELHRTGQEMWTPEELAWIGNSEEEKFLKPDRKPWLGPTVSYYDINSSYAATMLTEMPTGERVVDLSREMDWGKHDAGTFGGFVECTVQIPKGCPIPPLPHPEPKTGRLLFPTGQFHGAWPTCELALLRDPMVNGKIIYVKRAVWHRFQPMFKDMVQKLWAYRDKKLPGYDEGLSTAAKLIINSLYGKFGMRHERTSIVFQKEFVAGKCILCGNSAVPDVPGAEFCFQCEGSSPANASDDNDVWYQKKRVDAPYIIPHVAAWITAHARARLWRFMRDVINLGGKLYYVDTDSCITDLVMPSSTELGEFKDEYGGERLRYLGIQAKAYMIERVEHNNASRPREAIMKAAWRGEIADASTLDNENFPFKFGPGFPEHKPKVTLKGFPPAQRTPEKFARLRNGRTTEEKTLEWQRLEQVRTLARSGFKKSPNFITVKKSLVSAYSKRVLHPDGSTTPRHIWEPVGGFASEDQEAAE